MESNDRGQVRAPQAGWPGRNEVSVLKLKHDSSGWVAVWKQTLTDPTLDVPSTATIRGDKVYAVNARFGVASPDTASYSVTPLKL